MEETVAEDLASLGHTLSVSVLAVWERDGETRAVELVRYTDRDERIEARWTWLDVEADSPLAPHGRQGRHRPRSPRTRPDVGHGPARPESALSTRTCRCFDRVSGPPRSSCRVRSSRARASSGRRSASSSSHPRSSQPSRRSSPSSSRRGSCRGLSPRSQSRPVASAPATSRIDSRRQRLRRGLVARPRAQCNVRSASRCANARRRRRREAHSQRSSSSGTPTACAPSARSRPASRTSSARRSPSSRCARR